MRIELGVIKVHIRQNDSEKGFRLLQARLERLDILRGGIAATVRRLIISAVCRAERLDTYRKPLREAAVCTVLTITIHGAMSTRLFPVTFDLLAPAFITGPSYPSSLLQRIQIAAQFRLCGRFVGAGGEICIILGVILRIGYRIILILGFDKVMLALEGGHDGRWELVACM